MTICSAASTLDPQWKLFRSPPHRLSAIGEPPLGRVLVVEDQPVVALDLQRTLREAGYRTVGPAASLQAIEALLARGRIDAAIVDANAGPLAFAAADRLADADVPMLFLADSADLLPRRPDGGTVQPTVLAKPVARPRLLEALESVIAQRRLAEAHELPYAISAPPMSWPRVLPQL
jgi:CheY-like chemotaxis protein